MRGEGKYDGVFALWYGKGPGVDRSGDVFRHANMAGTSPHGGVLALMGDDHTAESSTTAHQSEFHFVDVMIPILNPAGVQEILDFGLYGYAMSRFCGTWVALKCIKDTVESTAIVDASLDRVNIVIPDDFPCRPAASAFARGRHPRHGGPPPRLEARRHGGLRPGQRAQPHHHVRRPQRQDRRDHRRQVLPRCPPGHGRPWHRRGEGQRHRACASSRSAAPGRSIPSALKDFARGLDLIIVVEEKRSLIEVQVREELYGAPDQPACIGKKDERGNWLFPVKGALDPNDIGIAIGERLLKLHANPDLEARVNRLKQAQAMLAETKDVSTRTPYFCSGCPHNSSTKVPEGMRAYAGIGCHYMVAVDGPLHGRLHPDGRRGRELDWRGCLLQARAHFPEPGRRHLEPFRRAGAALRLGEQGEHHLQAALQRRRRHDGRTAPRGRADGRRARKAGRRRRRDAHRARLRRSRQISLRHALAGRHDVPSSRRTGHRPARSRRDPGRDGDRLRPDLRRREAPPPQAGRDARSRQARLHQHAGLRGLRRLRRQVELRVRPAGRDGVRTQAADRPVELQQGLLLRQRLLPVLRDGGRRDDPQGCAGGGKGGRGRIRRRLGTSPRAQGALAAQSLRHHRDGRRRNGRGHHRRDPRHGGPSRRQGLRDDRHGRPRPEGRRGLQPCEARGEARGYPLDPRRRRRSGPRPRLRPCRDRHQEGARRREAGRDRARGQYRRGDAGRLRAQRRLLAPGRADQARRPLRRRA